MIGIYPHTATIEAVTARDVYGKPSAYTSQSVTCMVLPQVSKIVGRTGEELVSRLQLIARGPLTIAQDSVVTVPSEFGFPARMALLSVEHFVDPETLGLDVVRVYA
jgi:hypothetical protein